MGVMSSSFCNNKCDLEGFDIPDDILPPEEIGEALVGQTYLSTNENLTVDINENSDSESDSESECESDENSENYSFLQYQNKKDLFSKSDSLFSCVLPFINIHLSFLFILLLTIFTFILPNIVSLIATIIIIISVVKLDMRYKWGITMQEV